MNRRDFASMTIGALLVSGIFFCFIYFSPEDEYTRLPVSFSSSNVPIIEAKIGDIESPLELDLGSKLELKLDANVLSKLEKRAGNPIHWRDLKGNCYESPSHILPHIEIGGLQHYRVVATEDSQECNRNTLLRSANQEQEEPIIHRGVLGRPLLKNRVLLLDFPGQAMVVCSKLDQLDREEISPRKWHKIPLKLSRFGIILSIETDLGPQQFILDTGCTVTLIRAFQMKEPPPEEEIYGMKTFTSSKFTLAGEEFGPKRLYLFDIAPELSEVGGLLGMDFLSRHRIVLDLPHQTAYIEPVSQ